MNGDTSKKQLIIRKSTHLEDSSNVAQQLENNGKVFKPNKKLNKKHIKIKNPHLFKK